MPEVGIYMLSLDLDLKSDFNYHREGAEFLSLSDDQARKHLGEMGSSPSWELVGRKVCPSLSVKWGIK